MIINVNSRVWLCVYDDFILTWHWLDNSFAMTWDIQRVSRLKKLDNDLRIIWGYINVCKYQQWLDDGLIITWRWLDDD